MPLVIAILFIVGIFVIGRERSAQRQKDMSFEEKSRRMTNARLEQKRVTYYMQHGHSFNEAYKLACEYMVRCGFDPCIPKKAYKNNVEGKVDSSYCQDPEMYDSLYVTSKRSVLRSQWEREHPGHSWREVADEIDEKVYKQFPQGHLAYINSLKASSLQLSLVPVGDMLIYPGLGTCEVLEHKIDVSGTKGRYVLKVLKTGQIVDSVRIDDPNISHLG